MPPPPEGEHDAAHLGRLMLLWSWGQQPPLPPLPERERAAQERAAWDRLCSRSERLEREFASFESRLKREEELAATWQAISSALAVSAEWLGGLPFMFRGLAHALRATLRAKGTASQATTGAGNGTVPAHPVEAIDLFGRKISSRLLSEAGRRYFEPYLEEIKNYISETIRSYKGNNRAAFVRRQLRLAKILLVLAVLDSLRLAATDWVWRGIRRS
jgi:hypothetical protein